MPLPSSETLRSWLPLYLKKTDQAITHLNRILSTPSGTDALLLTTGYATLATSNALSTLALHRLYARAREFIELVINLPENTSIIIPPSALPSPRLLRLSQSLKALSDVISDFRIFVRLWGLLGIWKWGKSLLEQPPKDAVLRRLAWMQVAVNIAYQALENGAYLASKGVLGWDQKKQAKAWVWSSRFWAAHVLLEFSRLGYEWRKGKDSEKGKEVEGQNVRKWKRDLVTNLAYAPLTIHWGLKSGLVNDFWVGVLGTAAGMAGFLELWKNTS
jgi:hypothetical protein